MLQLHIQNYNTAEERMALHWKYSDHLIVFSEVRGKNSKVAV